MASRKSRKEAQDLKAKFQRKYPARTFRIFDKSGPARIGRGAAEGMEILNDEGEWWVEVNQPKFEILEVRACTCGEEVLTAAIGEGGLNECQNCREKRRVRQTSHSRSRADLATARRKRSERRDRWEEPHSR